MQNDCRWCAMPLEAGRSGYCDRVRVIRRTRLVSETPCRTMEIARILARKAKAEQPAGAAVEIRRGRDLLELYR